MGNSPPTQRKVYQSGSTNKQNSPNKNRIPQTAATSNSQPIERKVHLYESSYKEDTNKVKPQNCDQWIYVDDSSLRQSTSLHHFSGLDPNVSENVLHDQQAKRKNDDVTNLSLGDPTLANPLNFTKTEVPLNNINVPTECDKNCTKPNNLTLSTNNLITPPEEKCDELEQEEYEVQLIPSVLSTFDTDNWLPMNMENRIEYIPILPGTKSFQHISGRFYSTAKNQDFKITKIELIQNPILFGQYLLKKQELYSRYGNVEVEVLFHGSTERNITSICENNFNWKLCINSKFGHGISFSPISTYACYSCDKTENKQMLACLVLIAKECVGFTGMELPDLINQENNLRCDTAIKNDQNKSVVVKFSDHEFYPLYRISFTGNVRMNNALVRRR